MRNPWYRLWKQVSTFTTMLVVVGAALIAYLLENHDYGIPVIGYVQPGLHPFQAPKFGLFGRCVSVCVCVCVCVCV